MRKRKPTYLSFSLGKEKYAVSTLKVLEVLQPQYITPIPNSSGHVKGVISFRGNIVPVVCLRNKLELPEVQVKEKYVIIVFDTILRGKKALVAAIADNVNDVISADDNEKLPPPETGIKYNIEFVVGMFSFEGVFTLLLDIDKVLEIVEETPFRREKENS